MRLFRAFSIIDGVPHKENLYNDVDVAWYVDNRLDADPPVADLTAGWDQLDDGDKATARFSLTEAFTEAEARSLEAWLRDNRQTALAVKELALPYLVDDLSPSFVPLDPCRGQLAFHIESDYCPPFTVIGRYDVRHRLPVAAAN